MLHPGRVVETSERQPCVVGVVVVVNVVNVVSVSSRVLHSDILPYHTHTHKTFVKYTSAEKDDHKFILVGHSEKQKRTHVDMKQEQQVEHWRKRKLMTKYITLSK